jgi:hypothetical protein
MKMKTRKTTRPFTALSRETVLAIADAYEDKVRKSRERAEQELRERRGRGERCSDLGEWNVGEELLKPIPPRFSNPAARLILDLPHEALLELEAIMSQEEQLTLGRPEPFSPL